MFIVSNLLIIEQKHKSQPQCRMSAARINSILISLFTIRHLMWRQRSFPKSQVNLCIKYDQIDTRFSTKPKPIRKWYAGRQILGVCTWCKTYDRNTWDLGFISIQQANRFELMASFNLASHAKAIGTGQWQQQKIITEQAESSNQ